VSGKGEPLGLRNTDQRWGAVAKLFHWVVALLMIGLLLVGFFMVEIIPLVIDDLNDATTLRYDLTQTHKSFGFVVFVLACVRLFWRWINPVHPGLPGDTPGWQKALVNTTHYSMYGLMLLLPLSGWLMASASPLNDAGGYLPQIKNMVFGLFEMPDPFVPGDRGLEVIFKTVHEYAGYALAFLLVAHVAGVLYHHFILRDSVLTRMLPSGRNRPS
jgi:cytochrome b561